jgi:hypothetical protein
MEPLPDADIIGDVRALMSAEDEVKLASGGLFTKDDSLGELPGTLNHTSRKPHLLQAFTIIYWNSSPGVTSKQATVSGHNPFSGSSVDAGTKLPV